MTRRHHFADADEDIATIQRVQQALIGPGALLDTPSEILLAPHDIPVFLYGTTAYPPALPHTCPAPERIHGAGCGLTRSAAYASACGEAIERYCAWRCCTPEALHASARDLGAAAVPLPQLVLYSAAQYHEPQFHFRPLTDTQRLAWVEGWSWTNRQAAYLPTCFVYQGHCRADHPCVFHTVSTGLACGTSEAMTVLSGLCEVIERDAIMIAWLHGFELPRVLPPVGDPVLDLLYQGLAARHMQATVLDATSDLGVPVRLALVEHPTGMPAACAVGMAARLDPVQAHRKALLEAVHTLNWLHQLQGRRPRHMTPATANPQTFEEHVLVYGHDWARPYLDMWRCGPWQPEQSATAALAPQQQLDSLVHTLAAQGLEVLTVDVTLPDVEEAGFRVVRTVVPGMVPLTVGRTACLGSPRLTTVPQRLGHRARYGPEHWNPYPHPFP